MKAVGRPGERRLQAHEQVIDRPRTPCSQTSVATVSRIFESPRSYDPSYSLLGRALRRWTGDRLRGEAMFIVVLTGLALTLIMTHYLGWALLASVLADAPLGQMLFWGAQGIAFLLVGGTGLVGFRPRVTVACTADELEIKQGERHRSVPREAIEQIDTVSATTYHRHYRRYAPTAAFVSQWTDEMLLLRTADGPVVVALPTVDAQDRLQSSLEPKAEPASDPVHQA